jgi:Peptidase family M23
MAMPDVATGRVLRDTLQVTPPITCAAMRHIAVVEIWTRPAPMQRLSLDPGVPGPADTWALAYAASMTERLPSQSSMTREVVISLPFAGMWLARNSPARRVPSHGTDLLGGRYAIDFIGVDHRRRSADRRDWRTFLATEPAERFFAYGRPILAPTDGIVVDVHDGQIDHAGRRSQLALVPYALGQMGRFRQGVGAIAGNHLIIALRDSGAFVALAHLRAGSVRVAIGEEVTTGQPVADCGNSGNSTQPHVHVQVMDSPDPSVARGVPIAFRRFREWPRGAKQVRIRESGLPGEGAVVEPLPVLAADVGP